MDAQTVVDTVNRMIGQAIAEDGFCIGFKIIEGDKLECAQVNKRAIAPKYPIGTTYTTRHKFPKHCRVVDVHRTLNHKDEFVKLRYVAVHSIAGQEVTEYDVGETTISMGSPKLP